MKKILTFLALLVTTAPSWAALTLYTNEASYLAAVGATRTYIDFAGSPATTVSGATFSPDVTFGSCTDSANPGSCGTSVLHNNNAISDLGGSAANNGVASLAWRFNLPDVFAFSFNYNGGAIDAIRLVESSLATNLVDTTSATGFIGLIADSAFYGAIGVNALLAGDVGNDRYFIDDFRINGLRAVPEPGSLLLILVAISIVAALRSQSTKHLKHSVLAT
jgi:hypothetical protein